MPATALPATAAFGLVLACLLLAIAAVDFRRGIIPDTLNLLLAGLGVAWQAQAPSGAIPAGLAGAGVAFAALFGLRQAFHWVRGIHGLGLGDVKMAAAGAIWISPWNLPLLLMAACLAALAAIGAMRLCGQPASRETAIPFGPFIGAGLMLTWLLEASDFPTLLPDGGLSG